MDKMRVSINTVSSASHLTTDYLQTNLVQARNSYSNFKRYMNKKFTPSHSIDHSTDASTSHQNEFTPKNARKPTPLGRRSMQANTLTPDIHSPSLYYRTSEITGFAVSYAQITSLQQVYASHVTKNGKKYPGDVVFKHAVLKAPQVKQIFDSCTEEGELFDYNAMYIRFSAALNHVMHNLQDVEQCDEYLWQLGRKHVLFTALSEYSIEPNMWNHMSDALICLANHWRRSVDISLGVKYTWQKIVLYIVGRVREGYYEEVSVTNSKRPSICSIRCSSASPLFHRKYSSASGYSSASTFSTHSYLCVPSSERGALTSHKKRSSLLSVNTSGLTSNLLDVVTGHNSSSRRVSSHN